jgi:glycosyltransferase involved in cell wall biosynthesis
LATFLSCLAQPLASGREFAYGLFALADIRARAYFFPMSRVGYLSGSPRISTRFQAGEHGPACHVLGTISGFRSAGWEVFPYIVGDRVPLPRLAGPEFRSRPAGLKRLGADVFRIGSNFWHGRKAHREMGGNVDWAYERFGVFQSLGRAFQRSGIPWVLETNTPFALENALEPARKSVWFQKAARDHELQAYRGCDALIVQTAALKEIILKFAGLRAEKLFVVPNAVDLKRFSDPAPVRIFSGPTIGFVGALRRWQALEYLIHAIHDLAREGIPYNLVIIGDGEKRRQWQKLAQALGVGDRVFFADSIPTGQIPAWIAGFDIGFCGQARSVASQPMYFSPLKLYEYMAAAKPVLASGHQDSRRLIVPGETGYLFNPDSLPDLERALRQAWNERDSWSTMGIKAREVIRNGHTWEIRIKAMVAQLQNFLPAGGFPAG